MGIREWRSAVAKLVLAGGGLLPGVAVAESGFFATPSVSLAGIYDSNLFGSQSQREEDFIARLSPAIEVGHQSARMAFHGGYTLDAEAYARHPELDSAQARRHAATGVRYESTRRLRIAADASYTETQRPGELNLETGLDLGRNRAERLSIAPSLRYRFDPVAVGTAGYTFTRDKLEGGIGTDTHTVALGLERRVSRRDTATLGYAFHRFRFGDRDVTEAHVLTFGGTRVFSARTSATLSAGPRFSDGSIRPEISVSLHHTHKQAEFSVNYARSQSTAIGLAGPVTIETIGASAVYSSGRSLEIRVAPSLVRSTRGGFQAEVYRMSLDVRRRVTSYLSLVGAYEYSMQQGALDAPGEGKITRHVALLGIVVAPPPRRTDAPGPGASASSER